MLRRYFKQLLYLNFTVYPKNNRTLRATPNFNAISIRYDDVRRKIETEIKDSEVNKCQKSDYSIFLFTAEIAESAEINKN